MARGATKVDQAQRVADRLAASQAEIQQAEMELTDEQVREARERLMKEGDAHRYSGASRAEPERPKAKKIAPEKPRKAEADLFKQVGLRMHPAMIQEIQAIADLEHKDWATAARQLITEALRYRTVQP